MEGLVEDDDTRFVINTKEDKVLAGGFPNVRLFMTENSDLLKNRFRWVDTQLYGTL